MLPIKKKKNLTYQYFIIKLFERIWYYFHCYYCHYYYYYSNMMTHIVWENCLLHKLYTAL